MTPTPVPEPQPSPPAGGSLAPKPKVVASFLAGSVVTIGSWALAQYAHVVLPPEVAAAAVVIVSTVVAYLVPGSA